MEYSKKWQCTREMINSGKYPCKKILPMLKFQNVLERNIVKTGIAKVKCTSNKSSSCNNFITGTIRSSSSSYYIYMISTIHHHY